MPQSLDDILNDAETDAPGWKRTGNFESLQTKEGLAVLHIDPRRTDHAEGFVQFADRVRMDVSEGPYLEMRAKCEKMLRERPAAPYAPMLFAEDEEDEAPKAPVLVPVPTPRYRPTSPRVWGTIPIKNDED